jgi:uncharacterized protein (TIGR03435 family)
MKLLLIVTATVISCQAQLPAFEAASVKLSAQGEEVRMRREPGRLAITNFPLRAMVRYAYDVEDIQISGGPAWFNSDRWDIVATGGREISEAERRRMLQVLLGERFKMTIRHEMKELPVYALSVAKGGSKLTPGTEGNPERVELNVNGAGFHHMMGQSVTLSTIAKVLTGPVGRIVVDRTGINGSFDYKLEWVPDPASMPAINGARPDGSSLDGASIFTAVEEQLGLKLASTRGPVKILVIEHAEKAVEN